MRIPLHELKAGLSRYVARALAGKVNRAGGSRLIHSCDTVV